jgi:hypothetical protein
MPEQQSFQNHIRWYPLVHFVISPLLFVNLFWQIYRLYQEQTLDRAESLMLAVVFLMMSVAARLQALKAQDRIIRLEETLRYREVLPPELAEKASALRTGQMTALRFAPDAELTELLQRTLNGEFKNNKEIKSAVRNWRGDYLRV